MKKILLITIFQIALLSKGQNNFNRYFNEAMEQISKENYNLGIEKLSKALEYKNEAKNNYKIADAYNFRGYCRFVLKNDEVALKDFDEAILVKQEYAKSYFLKSLVYLTQKKNEDCITWCDKGLQFKPKDEDLLLNKSKALYGLKKYDESNTILYSMLEGDPKNISVIRYIASNFQRKKLWDSSIVHFSKALEINPVDYISFYDRGISKSYKKDYEGAKVDIEKAIQLDSISKFVGYNNLGFFLKLEQNDFKGAIEYFDKAINLDPKFAYAYSNRGFAKFKLGDMKGAYRDIKKSIDLDKTNSYAFKNLALVYIADGKKSNACETLKKAKDLGYEEMYDEDVNALIKEQQCGN